MPNKLHPGILNTQDGIVDLSDGQVLPHDKRFMCTRITPVGPRDTPIPKFEEFLKQVTNGDEAVQRYIQKWAGYTLTVSTEEQQFLFLYGPGGTGKTTLLNTFKHVMGDYAVQLNENALVEQRNSSHPTDVMRLHRRRMVIGSEIPTNSRWNESRIKSWTGGDTLVGRYMHQDFVEFRASFKMWVFGNYKPSLVSDDMGEGGMSRRIRIIPFLHRAKTVNKDLPEELKEEAPGILHWMIQGCLLWQSAGLDAPDVVLEQTAEYFKSQSKLSQFLEDRCMDRGPGSDGGALTDELFDEYKRWCEKNGERFMPKKKLVETLEGLHFERCDTLRREDRRNLHGFLRLDLKPEYRVTFQPVGEKS